MTEYAILGVLLLRALGRELPALAVGIAYAVTDELHQHFVGGRHASPVDVAHRRVGVAIGRIGIFTSAQTTSRESETRPVPGTGQAR